MLLFCSRAKSFGCVFTVHGHLAHFIPCPMAGGCPEASGIVVFDVCVASFKNKIAIIAVAGSCFSAVKKWKKKMSVTCANLRGRIDRKCTVICCAYVLSQTTSG